MWPVDSPDLLYDFVEEVEHAAAELVVDGERRACPWTQARPDRGGAAAYQAGEMMHIARFAGFADDGCLESFAFAN